LRDQLAQPKKDTQDMFEGMSVSHCLELNHSFPGQKHSEGDHHCQLKDFYRNAHIDCSLGLHNTSPV